MDGCYIGFQTNNEYFKKSKYTVQDLHVLSVRWDRLQLTCNNEDKRYREWMDIQELQGLVYYSIQLLTVIGNMPVILQYVGQHKLQTVCTNNTHLENLPLCIHNMY